MRMRTNANRADSAWGALMAYAEDCEGGEPTQDYHVADLVGDLAHYCDVVGFNFDKLVRQGRMHYEAEIQEGKQWRMKPY